MTTTATRFLTRKRRVVSFVLVAALIIIILLGLLSYFWLPGYVKSRIEIMLSEVLHRPVFIQSIDIGLYSLELTVNGFYIGEKSSRKNAQKAFFSFEKLRADLSIESVRHRAPVISAITLQAPRLRVVREDENLYNITDLINEFTRLPDEHDETEGEARFSVSNIVIEDGYVELIDQFKQSRQEIAGIKINIPFIANFAGTQATWVEPHFSAKVNGSPVSLDGKLRPFSDKREAVLALKLTDINLMAVDEYAPVPAGLRLLSGYFDSDLHIVFSQVLDNSPSITISGKAALKQLVIDQRAVARPYQAALEHLDIHLKNIDLTGNEKSSAAIVLRHVTLTPDGVDAPALALAKLSANDIQIDIAQQHVVFEDILLDRFDASIRREVDGDIDLAHLFTAIPQTAVAGEPSVAAKKITVPYPAQKPPAPVIQQVTLPKPAKKPFIAARSQVAANETIAEPVSVAGLSEQVAANKQSWAAQVNQLKLISSTLRFEDQALADVSPMVIDSFDLTLNDIDLTGKTPLNLEMQASVNQHGRIDIQGSLAWSPLVTDMNVMLDAVNLAALQGWAGNRSNGLLTRGTISFQGAVKAGGEPLRVALNGDGFLADINVFDKVNSTDLLYWKDLAFTGINFANEPLRIAVDSIKLEDFFTHLIITPQGDLNLGQFVRQDKKAIPSSPQHIKPAATTTAAPIPVYIGQVLLKGGNVKFTDRFIKPNYRANLTGLSGKIGPVRPEKPVKIVIRGAIDKSAPLEIHGNFNPFGTDIQLDISAQVHDIDMPTFSPYSGKHVGYLIEKGKLSVDIHYHIEEGALKAENNIFLDQLILGDQVDSPDALSLPLDLAISLLKNREGEIDIHLPIEGSINDPQFSLGEIIFDAFINLIMKAVTTPFALLGSVLDEDEELSVINFSAGQVKIGEAAQQRLQVLAEALTDRPALRLEITGYVDPMADSDGLKRVILDREIKAMKLSEAAKKGKAGGSLLEVTLEPEEYEKYLTMLYKAKDFAKPKNFLGFSKKLSIAKMEQLILAHIEINDEQLRALAEQRANAARAWLIEQGGIIGERIFVRGGKNGSAREDSAPGGVVRFSIM